MEEAEEKLDHIGSYTLNNKFIEMVLFIKTNRRARVMPSQRVSLEAITEISTASLTARISGRLKP